jgi:hypothetical protein
MHTVAFGTASEHVSLAFSAKPTRDGWVDSDAEVLVRAFTGRIRPSFEARDLERFLEGLEKLYASLTGSAELNPREEQLVLKFTAAAGGHIHLTGEAWTYARYGNRLEFELELDQTFLPEPISQLKLLLQSWKA